MFFSGGPNGKIPVVLENPEATLSENPTVVSTLQLSEISSGNSLAVFSEHRSGVPSENSAEVSSVISPGDSSRDPCNVSGERP